MKTLEEKYEQQKIIHLQKIKKQTEELEVLTDVLNEVKVSLDKRIAKYGEEDQKQFLSEYSDVSTDSSEQVDSDSSCSTLTFDREQDKKYSSQSPLNQVT